ncbi:hypothetical protein BOTBODRAFT_26067 [Botryobasidium botryosum FD-172 SS1]|uniref:Major facilitator superfamily (MFS) profile domain-containing protein n=1 Tax=Botryobasidium botryosum (strain FD-172 SS1) TaxID=930990 RepID=A0A067N3T5_BOTB1|nr:hypothetical protein BOTBODRAFT_26067 [Botryobasidium botryosum FD-172 SS1]
MSAPSLHEKKPDEVGESTIKELDYSHISESRILRKLDWHLLPFVSLLYLLSFLDRSNIGNANVAGLSVDLNLQGLQYNICAAVFFITYAAFEIPSNMAMKRFRPSVWIPSIMVGWGVTMTLMSLVKNYEGLLAARVFLGVTEAGLFPGVNFYISLWYLRKEQAKRIALFFSAATVAGAFGGILAFGIEKMDGLAHLHGWAWIFLLEGIVTVLVAIIAYFVMEDYPETATFLTEDERHFVVERLKNDTQALATHFDMKFFWQAISDPKSYLMVLIYLGQLVPLYAFSLFLPTIIKNLGFAAARAQLLSVPPYVVGCFFTVLIGILSDKYRRRGLFIFIFSAIAIVGYGVLYGTSSPGAGYAGTVIAAIGIFPTIPCTVAWASNNAGGTLKRGVTLAIIIGIGNLGGICSSFVYRKQDAPRYHLGHGVMIGLLCLSCVGSLVGMIVYPRLNKQKEELCAREGITEAMRDRYRDDGDNSPLFRYSL